MLSAQIFPTFCPIFQVLLIPLKLFTNQILRHFLAHLLGVYSVSIKVKSFAIAFNEIKAGSLKKKKINVAKKQCCLCTSLNQSQNLQFPMFFYLHTQVTLRGRIFL